MEIIFIRHAEPQWTIDGVNQVDPGLTERGVKQAELAADFLASQDRGIDEVVVSPALRAQQTAAPLIAATGVEASTVDELVEIRMPNWSDTPEAEVREIFRAAQQRHPHDWWTGLPGGEAFDEFHKRIAAAITEVTAARGAIPLDGTDRHLWRMSGDLSRRTVIVAHAGTNTAAIGTLLHIEPTPWEWDRLALGHASVSRVRLIPLGGEYVFSLRTLNDRAHLPRKYRSR